MILHLDSFCHPINAIVCQLAALSFAVALLCWWSCSAKQHCHPACDWGTAGFLMPHGASCPGCNYVAISFAKMSEPIVCVSADLDFSVQPLGIPLPPHVSATKELKLGTAGNVVGNLLIRLESWPPPLTPLSSFHSSRALNLPGPVLGGSSRRYA